MPTVLTPLAQRAIRTADALRHLAPYLTDEFSSVSASLWTLREHDLSLNLPRAEAESLVRVISETWGDDLRHSSVAADADPGVVHHYWRGNLLGLSVQLVAVERTGAAR